MKVVDMIFAMMFCLRATAGAAPEATAVLAVPLAVDIGEVVRSFSLALNPTALSCPLVAGVVFLAPLTVILKNFFSMFGVVTFLVLGAAIFATCVMPVLTSEIDPKLIYRELATTPSAIFRVRNVVALLLIPFTFSLVSFSFMLFVAHWTQALTSMFPNFRKLFNSEFDAALSTLFHYSLAEKLNTPIFARLRAVVTIP